MKFGWLPPLAASQAVIAASKKRFTIEAQADPVDFWSWLLNTLHSDLTGGRLKAKSIITDCFQVRRWSSTCGARTSMVGYRTVPHEC